MRFPVKLCISINNYEHALFTGQARAEGRSMTALIKYAAIQYCKAYPARIDPKKIFRKFVPNDEVLPR